MILRPLFLFLSAVSFFLFLHSGAQDAVQTGYTKRHGLPARRSLERHAHGAEQPRVGVEHSEARRQAARRASLSVRGLFQSFPDRPGGTAPPDTLSARSGCIMRRESHTRHTKSHAQNVHNLGTAQRAATASQPGRARVAQRHVAARLQPRVDAPVEADAALIRLIRGVALLVARGGRGQHDGPQVPGAVEIAERMPDRPLSAHAAAEGGLPGVCMHRQSRASCGERKASREHLQDSRVRVFASGSRNAGASTPHLRNGRPPTRRAAYSKTSTDPRFTAETPAPLPARRSVPPRGTRQRGRGSPTETRAVEWASGLLLSV